MQVPVRNAALQEWAEGSGRPVRYIMKGMNCRTEMYSALEAEVEDAADASTFLNFEVIGQIKKNDRLLVCGQALSHGLHYTFLDIMKHWHKRFEQLVLLEDGSSCLDGFERIGDEFLQYIEREGCTLSTTEDAFSPAVLHEVRERRLSRSMPSAGQYNNHHHNQYRNITPKGSTVNRLISNSQLRRMSEMIKTLPAGNSSFPDQVETTGLRQRPMANPNQRRHARVPNAGAVTAADYAGAQYATAMGGGGGFAVYSVSAGTAVIQSQRRPVRV